MSWFGLQDRHRLVDDVILVGLEVLAPPLLDQLDDPAWIEIDAETDPAAILRQVLDRQAQPPRSGRTEHQPVGAFREVLVGQRRAEQLVVGAEIVAGDARLRRAGRAAGLEDEHRLAGQASRDPALHRSAAQPLVLERPQTFQVAEPLDLGPADPTRASSRSRARTGSRWRGRNARRPLRGPARPARRVPPAPAPRTRWRTPIEKTFTRSIAVAGGDCLRSARVVIRRPHAA